MKKMQEHKNKLRQLREAYGLTRPQFGEIVGISVSSLQAYEDDRVPLSVKTKSKIILATGISASYFEFDGMSAKEAISEAKISSKNLVIDNKNLTYDCNIYKNLDDFFLLHSSNYYVDFYNGRNTKTNFLQINSLFMDNLFDLKLNEYCFIKINGNEANPLAKKGEILIVSMFESHEKAREALRDNMWLIITDHDTAFIKQYHKLMKKAENYVVTDDDFSQKISILGIIRAKMSVDTL